VTRGHSPELEGRRTGRHDRVLRSELAQRRLVVRLDNREAVGALVSQDGPEHDQLAALEVRAPVGSVAVHDLALGVREGLRKVRARSDEAQDKGRHER
jgi:hypothetical protein